LGQLWASNSWNLLDIQDNVSYSLAMMAFGTVNVYKELLSASQSVLLTRVTVTVLLLMPLIAPRATASAMPVAGGANPVLSILPPGKNGLVNPIQLLLAQFGHRPAGSDDELAPYAGLLYAGGALTDQTLTGYFHSETLSVAPADVAQVETLHPPHPQSTYSPPASTSRNLPLVARPGSVSHHFDA
jgi:hypothetical protein